MQRSRQLLAGAALAGIGLFGAVQIASAQADDTIEVPAGAAVSTADTTTADTTTADTVTPQADDTDPAAVVTDGRSHQGHRGGGRGPGNCDEAGGDSGTESGTDGAAAAPTQPSTPSTTAPTPTPDSTTAPSIDGNDL